MNTLFPLLIAFCLVPFLGLVVVGLIAWAITWFWQPKDADGQPFNPRYYSWMKDGWMPAMCGVILVGMVLTFVALYPLGVKLADQYVPVVPTQAVQPADNSSPAPEYSAWEVTGYEGTVCPKPDGMIDVISPEKDYRAMVRQGNGRLYQPCLPEEEIRPEFESSFTGYCLGETATCEMIVHTINSELWWDSDKDGTPDQMLASHVGSKVVTIHNGGWYKIVAGQHNGGLDLTPLQ